MDLPLERVASSLNRAESRILIKFDLTMNILSSFRSSLVVVVEKHSYE